MCTGAHLGLAQNPGSLRMCLASTVTPCSCSLFQALKRALTLAIDAFRIST